MSHFYFELRAREKIKESRSEGLESQAFHRNKTTKPNFFKGLRNDLSAILRFLIRNPRALKRRVIESRPHP